MSFLFFTKSKPVASAVIKNNLTTYCKIMDEPIDYSVGDCVEIKDEAHSVGLGTTKPEKGYVLSNNLNKGKINIIYVSANGNLLIRKVPSCLYRKDDINEYDEDDILRKFVEDTPVEKDIPVGKYVRPRFGHVLYKYDTIKPNLHGFLSSLCRVRKNDDGKITLAACLEGKSKVVEIEVYWLELSPFIE